MAHVNLTHLSIFSVGIVNIVELIDKPAVALCIWVLYWCRCATLQWKDKVLRVQHIQYREGLHTINCLHITTCSSNRLHRLLHLRSDVSINHLLITTELSRVITTDTLMEVRSLVLVERVRSKVQHTIVEALVLINLKVGCCWLLWHIALTLWYEHLVIEVTLIHLPHINEAKHQKTSHHIVGTQLLHLISEEQRKADEDNDNRTPSIRADHCSTHRRDIREDCSCRIAVHALNTINHLAFLIADKRTHHVWEYSH